MKHLSALSIVSISLGLLGTSCFKDPASAAPERKIQFVLYTDQDFSTDNKIISFRLAIQKNGNQTLWDSIMAPMAIKDIPDSAHSIVVEKLVPNNDISVLKVGFYYAIENVGNSWFLDSVPMGENFRRVEFNFR